MSETEGNVDVKTLLPALKEELGSDCLGVDDEHLIKFLHWKPNIERAAGRYRDFLH